MDIGKFCVCAKISFVRQALLKPQTTLQSSPRDTLLRFWGLGNLVGLGVTRVTGWLFHRVDHHSEPIPLQTRISTYACPAPYTWKDSSVYQYRSYEQNDLKWLIAHGNQRMDCAKER